jgi:hypothetical protein
MRDNAAFLIGGDDQRRQAGDTAFVLKRGDFALQRVGRRSDIVLGDVNASDQAFFRQRGDFRE